MITKFFDELMADPEVKKEYMHSNLNSSLFGL